MEYLGMALAEGILMAFITPIIEFLEIPIINFIVRIFAQLFIWFL